MATCGKCWHVVSVCTCCLHLRPGTLKAAEPRWPVTLQYKFIRHHSVSRIPLTQACSPQSQFGLHPVPIDRTYIGRPRVALPKS